MNGFEIKLAVFRQVKFSWNCLNLLQLFPPMLPFDSSVFYLTFSAVWGTFRIVKSLKVWLLLESRPTSSIFLLRFRYLIAVPPTISSIPDKTVNETDNLNLTCMATGVPSPFVSWVKVSSGQRTNGSLLQLTNINRSQAGEYRCEASNECGNAVETVNIAVPCKLQRCRSCHGILTIAKISVF